MRVLEYGSEGRATLFLHGFPGVRSKQNKDLAERAAAKGRRSFVPLYAGLGQADGEFSFSKCKAQVEMFAQELITRNGSIDIVGHSWGGYMALDLAAKYQAKIQQLVLMSPLIYFYTLDLAKQAMKLTADGNAALKLGVTDELAKDFYTLGNRGRAENFAKEISPETSVTIFQASNDDTTPVSYAESLVNMFKTRPHYEQVVTDHSFLVNREAALTKILAVL